MKKTLFNLLLFIFLLISVNAQIEFTVEETGKIHNYYNKMYLVDIEGKLIISNPFEQDIYNIKLYYTLNNLNIEQVGGNNEIGIDKVFLEKLEKNTNIQLDYKLTGITSVNPYDGENPIFYNSIDFTQNIFDTPMKIKLDKSQIIEYKTGIYGRILIVTVDNPATINMEIKNLELIKTPDINPNTEIDRWVFVNNANPETLLSGNSISYELDDMNATNGEVYWLNADVWNSESSYKFTRDTNINVIDNTGVESPSTGAGGDSESPGYESPELITPEEEIFVTKDISQDIVYANDTVEISIHLFNQNYGDQLIQVIDNIPDGFEFLGLETDYDYTYNETTGQLIFTNFRINSRADKFIIYKLRYKQNNEYGLGFLPKTIVNSDNKRWYSNTVSYIRQYVGDKNIFVQKVITPLNENSYKIDITVINLGLDTLSNLYLLDILSKDSSFREITISPSNKGEWFIPSLIRNKKWGVSYITDDIDSTAALPQVKGVLDSNVFYSVVSNQVINYHYNQSTGSPFEAVGILSLFLIFIYILVIKTRGFIKNKFSKEKDLYSSEDNKN